MAIDINGDGLIAVGGTSTTQGRVRLAEDTDNGTNYVELTSNAAITTNRTVTFPDANIDFTTGLGAAQGGTGATTLTAENVVIGNGTSAVKFVAPGTSGNVLTSNGSAWLSQAAAAGGGDYIMQVFTTPGTWTKPAGLKAIKVTVVGGGGGTAGSATGYSTAQGGAGGGTAIEYIDAPAIPGPQPYTVAAATPSAPSNSFGSTGNTSSFGSPAFLSATGGTGFIGPANNRRAGGSGSGGQINIPGQEVGYIPSGCANYASSGGSMFGFGVALNSNQVPSGNPGASYGYGAGATGNIGGPGLGQPGGPGLIIVEEFY